MLEQLVTRVDDGEGTFETSRKLCDVIMKFVAASNGLFQADDHEAVALFGLFSDGFALCCFSTIVVTSSVASDFSSGFCMRSTRSANSCTVLPASSAFCLAASTAPLPVFLSFFDVHDGRRHCP